MGHLFIIPGDLLQLRCAAILLSGKKSSIGSRWTDSARAYLAPKDLREAVASEVGRHREERCAHIGSWRNIELFRVDTGGSKGTPVSWYVDGAMAFVKMAAAHVKSASSLPGPHRIALPFIGVGGGEANPFEIARDLVPALVKAAVEHAVDIVLVTGDDRAWLGAAQQARAMIPSAFDGLSSALRKQAVALASAFAGEQKPVFFVGAGVSMDAGLPGWRDLLVTLAKSKLTDATDLEDLAALASADALAAAEVVARLIAVGGSDPEKQLADRVKEALAPDDTATMPGLGHRLIAALPAEGYVTTNFDPLLENAFGKGKASVLPRDEPKLGKRWVLKLHGTVGEDGLVLTRRSYLRYDARSRSLLSLVEASILLRHLVVVGFSLTDQNFFRAIDGVRQVLGGAAVLGTASKRALFTGLVVGSSERYRGEIWPDAAFVDFGPPEAGGRLQLVFLDFLNALVAADSHLLDERFTGLLSNDQQKLATALTAVEKALPKEGHDALRRAIGHYRGVVKE